MDSKLLQHSTSLLDELREIFVSCNEQQARSELSLTFCTSLPNYYFSKFSNLQKEDPVLNMEHRPSGATFKQECKEVRKLLSKWNKLFLKIDVLFHRIFLHHEEVHQLLLPTILKGKFYVQHMTQPDMKDRNHATSCISLLLGKYV
eukprot:GHVU01051286.1.p1 GENE.GHVU01051286.1~~GHVU01051286.1.p1  ORF type:complete len:146 (+),score=13.93 GHVU01051286.1:212-649(+)